MYQLTCTRAKAPDSREVCRWLQIYWASVWTLLHFTLPAPRIWRWLLDSKKIGRFLGQPTSKYLRVAVLKRDWDGQDTRSEPWSGRWPLTAVDRLQTRPVHVELVVKKCGIDKWDMLDPFVFPRLYDPSSAPHKIVLLSPTLYNCGGRQRGCGTQSKRDKIDAIFWIWTGVVKALVCALNRTWICGQWTLSFPVTGTVNWNGRFV